MTDSLTVEDVVCFIERLEDANAANRIRVAAEKRREDIFRASRAEQNRLAWSRLPPLEVGMTVYFTFEPYESAYRHMKWCYEGTAMRVVSIDKAAHEIVLEAMGVVRLILTPLDCVRMGLTLTPPPAALENALRGQV